MVPDPNSKLFARLQQPKFELDGSMGMAFGGAGGNYVPSFSQDFMNSTTLDPRITFSRGTLATQIDSTGKITYVPNNLVAESGRIEASNWSKQGATVVPDQEADPDGNTSAKIYPTTTGTNRLIYQSLGTVIYTTRVTARVKAAGMSWVWIGTSDPNSNGAFFNVTLGTIGSVTSGGRNAVITALGSGWYECSVTGPATTQDIELACVDGNATNIATTSGTNGLLVSRYWAEAVTYELTPRAYNSTSPVNKFSYARRFDNAAWTKNSATCATTNYVDHRGRLRARRLVEAAATAAHNLSQAVGVVGRTETLSVRAAVGANRNWIALTLGGHIAYFNIAAGTVGTVTAGATAICTAEGGGFYRCSITVLRTTSTANLISTATADNASLSFLGSTSNYVYVVDSQLNVGALGEYVENHVTAPTGPYYGPAIDYDPVTLVKRGFRSWQVRTNLLTQSQTFSTWGKTQSSATVNQATAPDGIALSAIKLVEDNTAGANHFIVFGVTYTAAVYTLSIFAKASERSWIQINCGSTFGTAYFNLNNGAVGTTAGGVTAQTTDYGNGWYRCQVVFTATAIGDAVYILLSNGNNGSAYSGDGASGLYLWGAQLELGTNASPYISTGAATVTRNLELYTVDEVNFTEFYNQAQGTFACRFMTSYTTGASSRSPFSANDASAASTSWIKPYLQAGAGTIFYNTRNAGVDQCAVNGGATTGGVVSRVAITYQTNQFVISLNGATTAPDTSGSTPTTCERLNIGGDESQSLPLNGYIQALSYRPSIIPLAQLPAFCLSI